MSDRSNEALDVALRRLFDDASADVGTEPSTVVLSVLSAGRRFEIVTGEVARGDLVGVRAGGAVADRQLVVSADCLDVVLDVTADDDGLLDVRGTVLGDENLYAVQLLQEAAEVALTVTDPDGGFSVAGLEPGAYALVVSGRASEVSATVELR